MSKITNYKIKIYPAADTVESLTEQEMIDYIGTSKFEEEVKKFELPIFNPTFMKEDENQEIIHKVTKELLDQYNSSIFGIKALFTKKKTEADVLDEVKKIISDAMLCSHYQYDSWYRDRYGLAVVLNVKYDPSLEKEMLNKSGIIEKEVEKEFNEMDLV